MHALARILLRFRRGRGARTLLEHPVEAMRAKTTTRAFIICLALTLSAGLAVAIGAPAFVCRLDSVPRFQCCCAGGEHGMAAQLDGRNRVEGAPCCDVAQRLIPIAEPAALGQVSQNSRSVVTTAAVGPRGPSSVLFERGPVTSAARARGLAIPLLLQKHSLLL
jgi:hypothetical protein